jgi:hypothetical protein
LKYANNSKVNEKYPFKPFRGEKKRNSNRMNGDLVEKNSNETASSRGNLFLWDLFVGAV